MRVGGIEMEMRWCGKGGDSGRCIFGRAGHEERRREGRGKIEEITGVIIEAILM